MTQLEIGKSKLVNIYTDTDFQNILCKPSRNSVELIKSPNFEQEDHLGPGKVNNIHWNSENIYLNCKKNWLSVQLLLRLYQNRWF